MSVALFLITHEGLASNLLSIGEAIIQKPNSNLSYIEVPMDASVAEITDQAEKKLAELNINEGILFFTDVYGSTPSNIAQQLATKNNMALVSGINLPMTLRLLNYRDSDKTELLEKALDGGRQGIQKNS